MSDLLSHWVCTSLGLCKDTLASQRSVTQPGSPEKSGRPGAGLGLRFTSHLDHSPAVLAATATCLLWSGMGVGVTFWDGPSQVQQRDTSGLQLCPQLRVSCPCGHPLPYRQLGMLKLSGCWSSCSTVRDWVLGSEACMWTCCFSGAVEGRPLLRSFLKGLFLFW